MSETKGKAAWLVEHRKPLQVKAAPYTKARHNELVIRNHAVAVNPVDNFISAIGDVRTSS